MVKFIFAVVVVFAIMLLNSPVFSQKSGEFKEVQTSPVTWDFIMHNEPNIILSPTRHNLGHTHNLDTFPLAFSVINNDSVAISIDQVRVGCPCTKLKRRDGSVAANDKLEFPYYYMSFGFPDNSLVKRSMWVMSPNFKASRRNVIYEAVQSFEQASFFPKQYEVVLRGKTDTLFVVNRNDRELKELGFYSFDSDYISIGGKNTIAKGSDYIVINKTQSPKEKIKSTITFFARGDSLCVFSVPLTIYP